MNSQKFAQQLAELGHVTRLDIFRLLVKGGKNGMPVSHLQDKLGIPASTLSHHISRMVQVGLVRQIREGRLLRCYAEYQKLNKLISFLTKECCIKDNI